MKKLFIVFLILSIVYGCSLIGQMSAQTENYATDSGAYAKEANDYFWTNYHQGNYDSIPIIIDKLSLAIAANPNDIISTTHLGFVHVWALSERQRLLIPKADIAEHIILSRKYFEVANMMNPHDLRVLGFLADLTLAEGSNLNNRHEQVKGYFMGLKAINKWPQFNKFTLGYVFSGLDKTDKNFMKGLAWQYETIDDCACENGTKKTDYQEAINKIKHSTNIKISRACWNSWIAPHNWEGFCLNWGDMLVKSGQLDEAKKIYNLAKQSDTYSEWPFKKELETRLNEVQENEIAFNKLIDEQNIQQQKVIMFHSKMACMGCHQMSQNEYKAMGNSVLGDSIYFLKKPF